MLVDKDKQDTAWIPNVHYMRVTDHFGRGNPSVAVGVRLDHGFCMCEPRRHVINVKLHHKVFGPVFVVIILQTELRASEFAIHRAAPAFGKSKSERAVESF